METPEKRYPTPYQKSVCWAALCGFCLLVLGAMVVALLVGIGYLFVTLKAVLMPVLTAGVLAYLLSPLVKWLQGRVKCRVLSVLLVLSAAGLFLAGLGVAIFPPLLRQSSDLLAKRQQIVARAVDAGHDLLESNRFVQNGVDMLYKRARKDAAADADIELNPVRGSELTYTKKLAEVLDYNSSYLSDKLLLWLTAGSHALSGLPVFLVGAVMVPIFLFYFLSNSESIVENWDRILPLRRSRFRYELVETLKQINGYIVAFVRGQMLVSIIDAVLLGIALKIAGLPYAVALAAVAALLGVIPYIGMICSCIPALLIAWFTWGDVSHLAVVLVIFVCVSQLDGWFIQPRVVGNRVGMHDMTVMFSVLFWSNVLGGVLGALLAVPLTAAIKVLFVRYVWSSLDGTLKKAALSLQEQEAQEKPALPPEG